MKNYSQDIMDYAALHSDFGLHDLYAYLDGEADISRHTVSWYLTKLTESGQLRPERSAETALAVCPFLYLRW